MNESTKQRKFKITTVDVYTSPHNFNVDDVLKNYDTSCDEIKKVLMKDSFVHKNVSDGFQMDLAKQLEGLLEKLFTAGGSKLYRCGYSPTMRETPDVAIGRTGQPRKIFIEIEFRPNVHKDIVKFLIGHKKQSLELGILIVAMNRKAINKNYPTMPEYEKCVQTIEELQADCPILVMGIEGKWVPA